MLTKIAITANGKYVRATNTQFGLLPIYEALKKADRKEIKDKIYTEFNEQFQYLLAIAIVLLIAEILILERRTALLSRVNLFGNEINREEL